MVSLRLKVFETKGRRTGRVSKLLFAKLIMYGSGKSMVKIPMLCAALSNGQRDTEWLGMGRVGDVHIVGEHEPRRLNEM